MKLIWKPLALDDRERIMDYIAKDNPQAALDLDELFEQKADLLLDFPKPHKSGRVKGTREALVHPNYKLLHGLRAGRKHGYCLARPSLRAEMAVETVND